MPVNSELVALLAPLSKGQRDVVHQAAFGGSRNEIAIALGLGRSTCDARLSKVFAALEVGSLTELIALYWQCKCRDLQKDLSEAQAELAVA